MNTFAIAQLRYDMAGPADDSWKNQAEEEFWADCAAEYAAKYVGYILDREDTAELIQRAAKLAWIKPGDDVARGIGTELLEIIRAYCVQNESEINAECVKRAEAYRREARDFMRGDL